jgi:hypothetical protein
MQKLQKKVHRVENLVFEHSIIKINYVFIPKLIILILLYDIFLLY